jgi:nuclear pore complex protein Nup155
MMGFLEKKSSPPLILTHLQHASRLLDQYMVKDEAYPELWDLLTTSSSGDYSRSPFDSFVKKGTIILPDSLFEQYDLLECKCFMGIFPEIHRVWLTIDNRLFLWNYEDGNDFMVYDELDQIIVSVGLVPAKKGVFIEEIQYILVIATPIEILLLGIFLHDGKKSSHINESGEKKAIELILYPTHLSIPSDHVNMLNIIGTSNGRIFMSGKDGNLYEFVYQAYDRWFRKRCRKANHTQHSLTLLLPSFLKFTKEDALIQLSFDSSRNLLFTLSEMSIIQAFCLGKYGEDMIHLGTLSNIVYQAQRLCPRSHLLDVKNFKIVSIHSIDEIESKYLHLVAITSNGIRLYFSTLSRQIRSLEKTSFDLTTILPSGIELIHVRLPPTTLLLPDDGSKLITYHILNNIHTTYYHHGIVLLANAISDDMDHLVCVDKDSGTLSKELKPHFIETSSELHMDSKTWAISEYSINSKDQMYST